MGAPSRVLRGVSLGSLLSLVSTSSAFSQAGSNPGNFDVSHPPSSTSEVWMEKCSGRLARPAPMRFTGESEEGLVGAFDNDSRLSREGDFDCGIHAVDPAHAIPPIAKTMANPCLLEMAADPHMARDSHCQTSALAAPAGITELGKAGERIARAREEVLYILSSENACAEWFERKDPTPTATFQSLYFSVDNGGPRNVLEWERPGALFIFRQPYVARSTQDGGANTSITINANGAFYKAQGQVQRLADDGGPAEMRGTRLLVVGSYAGNTLEAQIVTLLHEFGHVIDLLPEDSGDKDGRSAQNTREVLLHCRTEVESRSKEARHAAKK